MFVDPSRVHAKVTLFSPRRELPASIAVLATEEVPGREMRDLLPQDRTFVVRVPVVHAAVYSGVEDLLERLREAVVGAHGRSDAREVAGDGEREVVRSEEVGQRLDRRSAEASVGRRVLGMVWRRDEAQPARIVRERWVSAAGPDRGDRTPEHVVILGLPAG